MPTVEVCAYLDPDDKLLGKMGKHVVIGKASEARSFCKLVWDYCHKRPRPTYSYLAYFINGKRVTPERAKIVLGAKYDKENGVWVDDKGVISPAG